ncbi:minor capsid protein [Pseudobacteroides cellulosolvens]|uniref:Phage head morphogenesis protein, SPP1 gp7 family n=1 Tax=Pseudobacteroides cellulosolvens ATCC 35603 = DSM 2933 TaxID=398512 RepID=A0A0L6JGZ2_9FIRM|nr:minor capsid protein [Pseudobacteroides cellulosolvens]KNY24993.1 phage head morphogenesis protein, SPP1 gp7 family [Pseudobacteroides cellulosolvens ATCC 35603 = DSM 2933]
MTNKEYWIKRTEQNLILQEKKAEEYGLLLLKSYENVKDNIDKELSVFYQKYAINNNINYVEAQKLLSKSELSKFKDSLDEYIKQAKLYSDNPEYIKKLENMSIRARVRRIEALKIEIEHQIEILTSNNNIETGNLLNNIYSDGYYRSIWTVQTGLSIGLNFDKLNTDAIEKVVKTKWLGENYSDRIYKDKEKLIRTLETELTQSFIRGDSGQNTAKRLSKRLDISYNNAIRLVRTESNHISNESFGDGLIASGVVSQYEYVATLDNLTSEICQGLDGLVFKLSDRQVGVNYPPVHPNCRSTVIPYFKDEIAPERIARNKEGKTYYVEGDMTYEKWKEKYVD